MGLTDGTDDQNGGGSRPWQDDETDAPLPNRFTRGTFMGCLGILCVLTLPALLFIPVEAFHLPSWVQRLIPLVGVAVVVAGAWLLSRVPSAYAPRPNDPQHPLTSTGRAPVMERPASGANRTSLGVAIALSGCCVVGYLIVSTTTRSDLSLLAGTLIVYLAGLALLAQSVLAVANRVPVPAWRWVRIVVQRHVGPQAIPFACVAVVSVVWALFVASAQGYFWAPLGVGGVILAGALTGPILQRLPERGQQEPRPPAMSSGRPKPRE